MPIDIEPIRRAFERRALSGDLDVQDANPERNGNAYEGGFVAFLTGRAARAEVHVGRYIAEVVYDENSAGQSIHPIPELSSEEAIGDALADQKVDEAVRRIRHHIDRER